jgi:hypothetical protein
VKQARKQAPPPPPPEPEEQSLIDELLADFTGTNQVILDDDSETDLAVALRNKLEGVVESFDSIKGDEEQTNEAMMSALLALMDKMFRAGVAWHAYASQTEPVTVELDADEATEMMKALLTGDGFTVKLVVGNG